MSEAALALLKDEHLTPLLSKLAYWLHVHKPTGIATEQEVYQVLGEEWAEINDLDWNPDRPSPAIREAVGTFLLAVREHTGLFVERAPRRYGFMHLTFEEYYAARYLATSSRTRARLIRQHLHDPRWDEPILLALGFVGLDSPKEVTELLEAAILAQGEEARQLGFGPSPHEHLLGRDYLFALRCLGDQIPIRIRVMRPLIERLADEWLHRHGAARFQRYYEALEARIDRLAGSEGGVILGEILIAALADPAADVRSLAAATLGRIGERHPRPPRRPAAAPPRPRC